MLNPWKDISEHMKVQIIKYAYLVIVVAASITLSYLVYENKQLVNDIQNDRVRVAYNSCLDQNAKNAELKDFLRDVGNKDKAAVKFVNVLAPRRNCVVFVENLLGSKPNESN